MAQIPQQLWLLYNDKEGRGKGSTFTYLLQAPQILGPSWCYPETTWGSPEKPGLGICTCIIGLSVNTLAIHLMHQTSFLVCWSALSHRRTSDWSQASSVQVLGAAVGSPLLLRANPPKRINVELGSYQSELFLDPTRFWGALGVLTLGIYHPGNKGHIAGNSITLHRVPKKCCGVLITEMEYHYVLVKPVSKSWSPELKRTYLHHSKPVSLWHFAFARTPKLTLSHAVKEEKSCGGWRRLRKSWADSQRWRQEGDR